MSKARQEIFDNRENPLYLEERVLEREADFHRQLKSECISELINNGKTESREFDLLKVFSDTFEEFARGYGIGTLPTAEYCCVIDHLKVLHKKLSTEETPTFASQLEIDVDIVAAQAADELMR